MSIPQVKCREKYVFNNLNNNNCVITFCACTCARFVCVFVSCVWLCACERMRHTGHKKKEKNAQRSVENGGNICFCAGWHAVEGGRNPLATLGFCSVCRLESMNRYVQMYRHTNTQSPVSCSSWVGVLHEKKCTQIHHSIESLKLKSFQIYITWPLRNLFSSSQLFPESKKKKAACLILLKLIINLLHNAFEMVGLIRCEDQPTQ